MKKTLTKNLGLKVLAVAFSILLWVIVMNNERPITSKTYVGVPVTLLHTELITNQGNTYQVAEEYKKVNVTVRARKDVLKEIKASDIKVTEEDKDADGDTDKTTIEKESPEDDMELTDEERAVIESMGSDKGTEELDNSSETEDKPHEAPKLKNKTNQFARFLGENRLGGM